ncbi:MAG: hypothetical protein NTW05_10190, partial [Pseudonocardiales bacterium]|nr:hypothetical protein [Pseudonocardiales bacterium]
MRPRVNPLRAVRALLGRDDLPEGFAGRLEGDERLLASAAVAGGGHVVVTTWGIWFPGEDARVGWHRVSKATWGTGALAVVLA